MGSRVRPCREEIARRFCRHTMDFLIIFFFKKRKKEKHFNKVESQHKEEQQRTQVLHLLEVIKLHQESIKQINTVKKKM